MVLSGPGSRRRSRCTKDQQGSDRRTICRTARIRDGYMRRPLGILRNTASCDIAYCVQKQLDSMPVVRCNAVSASSHRAPASGEFNDNLHGDESRRQRRRGRCGRLSTRPTRRPAVCRTPSTSPITGTIVLASDLPQVTNPVAIISGSSETGTPPTIGIDFNQHAGLVFGPGAAGSELIGLSLGNADGHGVTLAADGILLNNNYIGLALDGTASGNSGDGVFIAATSSGNLIGYNPEAATIAAAGDPATGVISNVISANGGNGISFHGSADNVVVSNRIGTSVDGNTAMGNGGNGIWLTNGSNGNTIGGTVVGNDAAGAPNDPTGDKGSVAPVFVAPPLGNLVSGNAGDGILIDTQSQNNLLNGNYVGTAASGNTALGNQGDGVAIVGADFNSLHGCTVVDNPFIYYNVVSGNAGNGIRVTDSDHVTIRANFVGTGANNAVMVGNAMDGILIDGASRNTQVGGVIPLGNVVSGNSLNGIEVADTASGFSTVNTFAGIYAFVGIAPNGNNGILITSTGGNQTVQTNVISGNLNNGLEISGDAWGVTVVPNIIGLDTRGDSAFANGNNGILIAGTAHDNVVGGTGLLSSDSVIRQNTISGNDNYGIVIAGQAYNNVVGQSAIGTDIQELAALPNGAGGVLLQSTGVGNVIGTANVGWSPLPAPATLVNVISANTGNGVTLDPGVDLAAVVGNWIGLNVNGQGTLPNGGTAIQDGGTYNLIFGNLTAGPAPLPMQSPTSQLEALYVGWFGRAADPLGFEEQMSELLTLITGGQSLAEAILAISDSFATSPENAPYAALAAQPVPVANPSQLLIDLTDDFISQTFTNLFDRPADLAEMATWRNVYLFRCGELLGAGLRNCPVRPERRRHRDERQDPGGRVFHDRHDGARGRTVPGCHAGGGRRCGRRNDRVRFCCRHQCTGGLQPRPDRLPDDPEPAGHHHRRARGSGRCRDPDGQQGHDRHDRDAGIPVSGPAERRLGRHAPSPRPGFRQRPDGDDCDALRTQHRHLRAGHRSRECPCRRQLPVCREPRRNLRPRHDL
jgi:hypothetical protein